MEGNREMKRRIAAAELNLNLRSRWDGAISAGRLVPAR
jgi:hypothetical protein